MVRDQIGKLRVSNRLDDHQLFITVFRTAAQVEASTM